MPIRELIAHLQQHRAEMNEVQDNTGRQVNEGASESESQVHSLTNAINVGGVPITNSVSGAHSASTSSGHTGNFKEQFSIGNLGLTAGVNSEHFGTGFGINRKPGEFGIHLGSLNFGLTNQANANKNPQTVATSSATGAGAATLSETNTNSNTYGYGNAVSVQNTVSHSHAHSSSLTGTTSANAGATSATMQNAQYQQQPSNPIPTNPQPDVAQQNSQLPYVEMKVIIPQPGGQQNPQTGVQPGNFPQTGPQPGYQQPNYQRPDYQPTGIPKMSVTSLRCAQCFHCVNPLISIHLFIWAGLV